VLACAASDDLPPLSRPASSTTPGSPGLLRTTSLQGEHKQHSTKLLTLILQRMLDIFETAVASFIFIYFTIYYIISCYFIHFFFAVYLFLVNLIIFRIDIDLFIDWNFSCYFLFIINCYLYILRYYKFIINCQFYILEVLFLLFIICFFIMCDFIMFVYHVRYVDSAS
jgi:hypothetical protein